MDKPTKVFYTAEVTAEGGREGHAHSSDGRLDVDLDVPTQMGGSGGPGTNPEQLFAAAWANCFQSSLLRLAQGRKIDLTGARVTAQVSLGTLSTGGFGIAAVLSLEAPGISGEDAFELMSRAHEACPYSRATRGNVAVSLTADATAERKAA